MSRADENERLARAAEGHESAFVELIELYGPALIRYLRAVMRDRGNAEDVAQESFVRAFMRLDRLRSPERFRHWLWKIGRCAALDAMRKTRRATAETEVIHAHDLDKKASRDASAEVWMEYQSLLTRTRSEVERLPNEMRELLDLRYTQQCSYQEMAARTGLTLVQVKARLARARAKLRGPLDPIAQDWKQIRDEMS